MPSIPLKSGLVGVCVAVRPVPVKQAARSKTFVIIVIIINHHIISVMIIFTMIRVAACVVHLSSCAKLVVALHDVLYSIVDPGRVLWTRRW